MPAWNDPVKTAALKNNLEKSQYGNISSIQNQSTVFMQPPNSSYNGTSHTHLQAPQPSPTQFAVYQIKTDEMERLRKENEKLKAENTLLQQQLTKITESLPEINKHNNSMQVITSVLALLVDTLEGPHGDMARKVIRDFGHHLPDIPDMPRTSTQSNIAIATEAIRQATVRNLQGVEPKPANRDRGSTSAQPPGSRPSTSQQPGPSTTAGRQTTPIGQTVPDRTTKPGPKPGTTGRGGGRPAGTNVQ